MTFSFPLSPNPRHWENSISNDIIVKLSEKLANRVHHAFIMMRCSLRHSHSYPLSFKKKVFFQAPGLPGCCREHALDRWYREEIPWFWRQKWSSWLIRSLLPVTVEISLEEINLLRVDWDHNEMSIRTGSEIKDNLEIPSWNYLLISNETIFLTNIFFCVLLWLIH